jgi:hypothetical protein
VRGQTLSLCAPLAALSLLFGTGGLASDANTGKDVANAAPTILDYLPDTWKPINEEQIFLLQLAAVPTPASIEANASCSISEDADRVPIRVLLGADRDEVLTALDQRDESVAVVRCSRVLPSDSTVTLHWGAGVAATSGSTTQVEKSLQFHVRKPFTVLTGCDPQRPIPVRFSAPVPRASAWALSLVSDDGRSYAPTPNEWGNSILDSHLVDSVVFNGPFPENSTLTLHLPGDLVDNTGRTLSNATQFPHLVKIGVSPPFSRSFGVLESKQGGILPIVVRNFDAWSLKGDGQIVARMLRVDSNPLSISSWFKRVEDIDRFNTQCVEDTAPVYDGSSSHWLPFRVGTFCFGMARDLGTPSGNASVFRPEDSPSLFAIEEPRRRQNEQWPGIALRTPGFYVVELESQAPASFGQAQVRYVTTSALVTDLAVHFQWGTEGSVAWVTRLSNSSPVADAAISVSDHCTGVVLWQGKTNHDGIATIPTLPSIVYEAPGCDMVLGGKSHPYLITARHESDFSFALALRSMGLDSIYANPDLPYDYSYHYGGFQVTEGISRRKRTLPPLGKQLNEDRSMPKLAGNPVGPPVTNESKVLKIGLRDEGIVAPSAWRFGVVASTHDGRPVRGRSIVVKFYSVDSMVGPEHSVGGFDSFWDTRKIEELQSCQGLSDSQGKLSCILSSREVTGMVVVRAESHDDAGHIAGATLGLWPHPAAGRDLDMLREKSQPLEAGETARIRIKARFRTATALVTVTRYGQFLSSFVKHLSGETTIIELPVALNYAPEVTVTVLVVGRAEIGAASGQKNKTQTDSAQPQYQLGAAVIKVKADMGANPAAPAIRGGTLSLPGMPLFDRVGQVHATTPPQ